MTGEPLTGASRPSTAAASLPSDFPPGLLADLMARYAEPGRAYHNMAHVDRMWRAHVDEGGDPGDVGILYAALYHDAVYVPASTDNEKASWRLFKAHAPSMPAVSAGIFSAVRAMILATSVHPVTARRPHIPSRVAWFCDLDLLSLGCDFDAFQEFGRLIRIEFANVGDEAFMAGRVTFFKALLTAPSIYATKHFRQRFEAQARDNIARAMASHLPSSRSAPPCP